MFKSKNLSYQEKRNPMILSVCPNPSIDTYAWLQQLNFGGVNRIEKLKEFPGGKGTHVAFALKQLGVGTSLFGNWAGNNGEWIKNASMKAGIRPVGIPLMGNNRKCYTFRSGDKTIENTELLEPGPEMTERDWQQFLRKFSSEVKKHEFVCMSGSWPTGAPDDAYLQLLLICTKHKKRALLDCSGIQLKNALKTKFFGLHINEHEALEAFGINDSVKVFSYLKDKVTLLALTNGKEGLYLRSSTSSLHANVVIDKVVSTVGSGDCLTAGIAYGVSNGLTLEDTAKYGVACGAANCLNDDLGMLKASDVENLFPKVKITIGKKD